MVSALASGSRSPGSSPGQGHCVVFLGKPLHSHNASLQLILVLKNGEMFKEKAVFHYLG